MHFVRPLAIAALLFATIPSTLAGADQAGENKVLKAFGLPQAGSPIAITYCAAALAASAYGTARDTLAVGLRIRNVGSKTATAIRFRFDFLTDFGEVDRAALGEVQTIEGTYSPGAKIDLMTGGRVFGRNTPKNTFVFDFSGSPDDDRIVCSIDKVAYDDGSVWSADTHNEYKAAAAAGKLDPFEPAKFANGMLFGTNQGL